MVVDHIVNEFILVFLIIIRDDIKSDLSVESLFINVSKIHSLNNVIILMLISVIVLREFGTGFDVDSIVFLRIFTDKNSPLLILTTFQTMKEYVVQCR